MLLVALSLLLSGCGGGNSSPTSDNPRKDGIPMGGSVQQGTALAVAAEVSTLAGPPPGFADGTGAEATFSNPVGVAIVGTALFVTDTSNNTIRKVEFATRVVTTLAGNPAGSGTADGTGAAARFNRPYGITTDGTNLYVADRDNHTIRKVEIATGVVTTVAGNPGVSGAMDGTGSQATFYHPSAISCDGTSLFVADTWNDRIRRIDIATGVVTTLTDVGNWDTLTGTEGAAYFRPRGITTDGIHLFATESGRISSVVIATGERTTLAGGENYFPTDGIGPAAGFGSLSGITTDGTNLYVSDDNTVRKVVIATGEVTTVAGVASNRGAADGTGTDALFFRPAGIATDGVNVFVADYGNRTIRKVAVTTGEVTTLAGSPVMGAADGTGAAGRFYFPRGITTDGTSLFVADTGNLTIRRVTIATGQVSTLAGSPGAAGTADGTGVAAKFFFPYGITTDGTNLYVSERANHTIRKVEIATGVVTTLAGSAGNSGSADGTGVAATFTNPDGITTDGTNLYVVDSGNMTIRKVSVATGVVTTLAGFPGVGGTADGKGAEARFSYLRGITTDGVNLYVTDTWTIRKVVIATGEVTTLAGNPGAGTWGSADGTGAEARFDGPSAITTDGTSLFVTEPNANTIREVSIATGLVTTLSGKPYVAGMADGTGAAARFSYPDGITTDGASLFIVDTANGSIRRMK